MSFDEFVTITDPRMLHLANSPVFRRLWACMSVGGGAVVGPEWVSSMGSIEYSFVKPIIPLIFTRDWS